MVTAGSRGHGFFLKENQSSAVTAWLKGLAAAAKLGEALVMQTDTVMLETNRDGLYPNGTSFQGGESATHQALIWDPLNFFYSSPQSMLICANPQNTQIQPDSLGGDNAIISIF